LLNHAFRAIALVFMLLAFVPLVLRYFPRTRALVDAADVYMGHPTRDVAQAIVNYLPNLVYLAIIIALGWLLEKLLKYFFNSLADGSLTISGFLPEWAVPTFKLCRGLLFLFLLMISYPYLPGSSTEAFKGFSVFLGALVTFGSSGSINNIVSGLVLTYARAFRVGDMVKIGDVVGIVIEKTTLTTRVRTARNEEVTIPNSIVLANTVVDYTARASSDGLVLTVTAGIGYDVDWRTVEALMIDAASRTENILTDPAPFVLKSDLGNYAVVYDLMATTNLTDQPDRLLRTSSDLRKNVLDAFNAAGVEIMTPSVLAHRDASGLAVPLERFPERPGSRGIKIDLSDEKNPGA
jgi:small-conductance mechanosensitive channel